MGKIILTERQYRNLNQILIGKEVENNKGRLNEMTEDEKLNAEAAGKKIQAIYKKCDTSRTYSTCVKDMIDQLKVLKTKEQFDYAAKFASYWFKDNWPGSLGNFLKKLMSSGNLEALNVKPFDVAKTFAAYFKVAGGTLGIKRIVDAEGNQTINPMGLTLSWKPVTQAKATETTTTNRNWGGTSTNPDLYWNGLFEKLKPYGAKLDDGENGPFMYWGKNYIMKDYSAGGGFNIVIDGLNYKFADGGKYAGQPLESITLTPKINGKNQNLVTLLGKKTSGTEEKKDKKVYDKRVVGGGGTVTGGGGSPFSGQYADLV